MAWLRVIVACDNRFWLVVTLMVAKRLASGQRSNSQSFCGTSTVSVRSPWLALIKPAMPNGVGNSNFLGRYRA